MTTIKIKSKSTGQFKDAPADFRGLHFSSDGFPPCSRELEKFLVPVFLAIPTAGFSVLAYGLKYNKIHINDLI